MQIMIYLGYDVWGLSILYTLSHLVHHMYKDKWEYLMVLIQINNIINESKHNQLHMIEPLHLIFEGMMKLGTHGTPLV